MKRFKKTRGVIACGHPLTAEAGAWALREGGNAADAAVAAAFASCVTEVTLTGLWGGGFGMVHSSSHRQTLLYDFFVNMPGLGKGRSHPADLDFKSIHADFRGALQEFHIGKGSVGVPGNILGLWTLHQRHGRLSPETILVPAIAFAREGVPMTASQAFVAQILRPVLTHGAAIRKIFAPRGDLLKEGEILRLPMVAKTLEALAQEGPGLFYNGELARRTADTFREGGLLTLKDLENYRVVVRKPLRVGYRGETILMNPPPSSGGSLIRHSLRQLEAMSLRGLSFGSFSFLEKLIGVMRETNRMRECKERLRAGRDLLGNTTHISVMDEEGNAVSLTTSHGAGAGLVAPGLGLAFNNMLGEQDLNPLGFHKLPPGKRFRSMMCPCITLKRGKPHLVLGSGGSNRLRTAILQALVNCIDFGMPLKRVVEGPRIHWEAGELNAEPGFGRQTLRRILRYEPRATFWRDRSLFFGGVHTVMYDPSRPFPWTGAGDPRRGGAVKSVR